MMHMIYFDFGNVFTEQEDILTSKKVTAVLSK